MSYQDRLKAEINAVLDRLAEEDAPWKAQWIANEICNRHSAGLVEGEDADFWRHCGYADCREQVRRCINARAGSRAPRDGGSQGNLLQGWEHLQHYYMVEREGEEIGIPIHSMTPAEISRKSAHYRSMSAACSAHADELEKYLARRGAAA